MTLDANAHMVYNPGRMATRRSASQLPIPVLRSLRKLGHDIRDARRRRRIPVAVMAERASISRTTLGKVEKGNPGVSLGIYGTVLFVLGFVERLGDLADPGSDEIGLALEGEHLPQRIRRQRRPPSGPHRGADRR